MSELGKKIAERRMELGMSQDDLGAAVGLTDAAIGKIERGETRRPNNLAAFAAPLQMTVEELESLAEPRRKRLGESHRSSVTTTRPQTRRPGLTPVVGRAFAGIRGSILGINDVIDWMKTPPELDGVPDAYILYVHGESMVPRYYPGEIVYVNPHKPVPRNSFCVVQISETGTPDEAYIKQFIGFDTPGNDIDGGVGRFLQFNPAGEITWPIRSIYRMHLIVGTGSDMVRYH